MIYSHNYCLDLDELRLTVESVKENKNTPSRCVSLVEFELCSPKDEGALLG